MDLRASEEDVQCQYCFLPICVTWGFTSGPPIQPSPEAPFQAQVSGLAGVKGRHTPQLDGAIADFFSGYPRSKSTSFFWN